MKRLNLNCKQQILAGAIGVVVLVAGFIFWWQSKDTPLKTEGSKEPVVTYSTSKPNESKKDADAYNWRGAFDEPKTILIPSLGVKSYIQKMGVDQNKQVAVPNNIHMAGWFVDSAKPGNKGLAIIDGHVTGPTANGVFLKLKDMKTCLQWTEEDCISPDSDSDGVTTEVEEAGPNSGDANNDGTDDSTQNNVVSLKSSQNNKYVIVEVSSGCSLTGVSIDSESSKSVKDGGFDYTAGLVNFTADCGSLGASTPVRVFFYGTPKNSAVLRKFNPNTSTYFTIGSDFGISLQETTIDDQTVTIASYTLADNSQLDMDQLLNGILVDPVGLGAATLGVPNTGIRR